MMPLVVAACLGTWSHNLIDPHHLISSARPACINSGGNKFPRMSSKYWSMSSQSFCACSTGNVRSDGDVVPQVSISTHWQFHFPTSLRSPLSGSISSPQDPVHLHRCDAANVHSRPKLHIGHQTMRLCI